MKIWLLPNLFPIRSCDVLACSYGWKRPLNAPQGLETVIKWCGLVGMVGSTDLRRQQILEKIPKYENMTFAKLVSNTFLWCFSMLPCKEALSNALQTLSNAFRDRFHAQEHAKTSQERIGNKFGKSYIFIFGGFLQYFLPPYVGRSTIPTQPAPLYHRLHTLRSV